jgi:hypothetical protein
MNDQYVMFFLLRCLADYAANAVLQHILPRTLPPNLDMTENPARLGQVKQFVDFRM